MVTRFQLDCLGRYTRCCQLFSCHRRASACPIRTASRHGYFACVFARLIPARISEYRQHAEDVVSDQRSTVAEYSRPFRRCEWSGLRIRRQRVAVCQYRWRCQALGVARFQQLRPVGARTKRQCRRLFAAGRSHCIDRIGWDCPNLGRRDRRTVGGATRTRATGMVRGLDRVGRRRGRRDPRWRRFGQCMECVGNPHACEADRVLSQSGRCRSHGRRSSGAAARVSRLKALGGRLGCLGKPPDLPLGSGKDGWHLFHRGRAFDRRRGDQIALCEIATGEIIDTVQPESRGMACVARSPIAERFASASYERTVDIWQFSAPGQPHAFHRSNRLKGHTGPVTAVAYSPDGKLIASVGQESIVRLWDTQSGQQRAAFLGHEGDLMHVAFSPDGRVLATAGNDGTVRLWRAPIDP